MAWVCLHRAHGKEHRLQGVVLRVSTVVNSLELQIQGGVRRLTRERAVRLVKGASLFPDE